MHSEAPPDLLRWKVGDVSICVIPEVDVELPATMFFPAATIAEIADIGWLYPRFMTDNHELKLRMQAFVVETPDRLIVVDTCYGNDKQRPGDTNMLATPFLERFGQAGYDPEKVDTVLCTHLHVDHVGWNTRLVGGKWVPTFPNARYLIARVEHENWSPADREMVGDYYTDSIQPIFDAGLVDLVETDHCVSPEVSLIPTPGHTGAMSAS
jgi:glyoxylase-like metal-dependent hydrolase (beta-lactamase superfamily II)